MREPTPLYRYAPGWSPDPDEPKPLSRSTFKVGEFRKVSWCKTHDAEWCTFADQGFENSDGCWRGAFDGGMPRSGLSFCDHDCEQIELWVEVSA